MEPQRDDQLAEIRSTGSSPSVGALQIVRSRSDSESFPERQARRCDRPEPAARDLEDQQSADCSGPDTGIQWLSRHGVMVAFAFAAIQAARFSQYTSHFLQGPGL